MGQEMRRLAQRIRAGNVCSPVISCPVIKKDRRYGRVAELVYGSRLAEAP